MPTVPGSQGSSHIWPYLLTTPITKVLAGLPAFILCRPWWGGGARRKTLWTASPCCAHGGHRGPSIWAPSSWFLLLPEPTP